MIAFNVLMLPIHLIVCLGNFIEWLHKKVDPEYITYSEYLSSMGSQERSEYARQRRIERRAVYNHRRQHGRM